MLGLIYVGNTHMNDRLTRQHNKIKKETQDLRFDYMAVKSLYMKDTKQSEISARVKELELIQGDRPPYKIIIDED